jgi:hypothetical protein
MRQIAGARPGLAGVGRAATMATVAVDRPRPHAHFTPCCLVVRKRGRDLTIAKLVLARPMNQIVLAMPYRDRQRVDHVSLPPAALRYARGEGATAWVVRLDPEAKCYSLPLAQVERCGWLKRSDGAPEWFVPLPRFTEIPWQDWPFVERVVRIDPDPQPEPAGHQLSLLPGFGG